MGHIFGTITLKHPENGSFVKVRALIDTGATHTVIPQEIARELGLRIIHKTTVETAKGSLKVEEAICKIKIGKREHTVPVTIAKGFRRVLVGVTTLETMALALDPKKRKLVKSKILLYLFFNLKLLPMILANI